MILLMDTIAANPLVDPHVRWRAREFAIFFRYPRGIYRWLFER